MRASEAEPRADGPSGALNTRSHARSFYVVAAVGLLGAGLAFIPGLGRIAPLVESDYCYQLMAADRLFDGLGPTSLQPVAPNQLWAWAYDWGFLTQWPVGYPVMVAVVRYVIGGTSLEAARVIGIICCAAALVGWFVWIGTIVPFGRVRWIVAGLGATSAVPLAMLLNPSTDIIVIAAIPYLLLLTVNLDRVAKHGTQVSGTVIARRAITLGVLAGGLFWIRYASVFVPFAIGLYLLIACIYRRRSWRQVILYSIGAATPIVLLVIVNSVFGSTQSAAATLNLGSSIEPAFSPAIVAGAWSMFTSLGYFDHRAIVGALFALWPLAVVVIVVCVRPVRAGIFQSPGRKFGRVSSAVSKKVRTIASPLTKGGLRGVLRSTKNLPRPLLVKEGGKKSNELTGNGSSPEMASDRLMLSACLVLSTLLMLVVATTLFGAKYDYVGLDRYYLPIRPMYFALFVLPALFLRSRIINGVIVGVGMVAVSWTVQIDWARAHDRVLTTQVARTPYGQWSRSFGPNADRLYAWLAERNEPGLVVVSNYHEYIALETGMATLPIPSDAATLNSWLNSIKIARGIDQLEVLFVLDPDNRWRSHWIPEPSEIVNRFGLTERPVHFDEGTVDVFIYTPHGVATGLNSVRRIESSLVRAD